MRSRHIILPLAAALTLLPSAFSQDPGKIIDQYRKAAGGSKVLSNIRTLTLEGTLTSSTGQTGSYTFNTRLPNRYYSEIILGEQHFIQAYNGKSAWQQSPALGVQTVLGPEGAQLAAAARYYNSPLLDAKKSKLFLTFAGHASVRGRDALQLDVATSTGLHRQVFFDAQSHLIVRETFSAAGADTELLYDDYRPADGVQLPRKIQIRRGADSYGVAITRAAVNAQVGERVFDFPRSSQVQLPDLKALVKEIDDNQKKIEKIKEDYASTEVVEETELDGSGKIKKTEVREFEIFFLHGRQVRTLKKKDGKPLSPSEEKKENERVQKRIAELQKKDVKKEEKAEKARKEGKEDDSEVGIEVFLRACQFVNPRRERFHGQDVLVFDFEPNPDFKPRKLTERLVHSLTGVVWIDEQAHQVARLEAWFSDNVKIGGGMLVNLQKGTHFAFEQAYLNNEVWLPTYAEAQVFARFLLVKGIKVNETMRYSDYRKFHVESLSTVSAPKPQ